MVFFKNFKTLNFLIDLGLGFLGLSLLSSPAPAYANFPLPPRLSALGYASDYAVGQADLMLPVFGNPSHNNLYIDPALSYGSDNQNQVDIGLGYRWIANQAAILGGYLFGGYSRIDNNARLWVVNPGIEALGSRWDAHLNAYFPMGDRHTNAGNGLSNSYFTGHSQFADEFIVDQYVGNGADVRVGYQLFPESSIKAYLGSYYFSPAQTNNVWGGAAGVEYWLTQNVKMLGSYTYDNLRHSTYAFGIGIEWGGTRVHRVDPTLEERLTDPVERYLAELGRGSTIPSRIKDQSTGDSILLADNIAFFSQTGGPNNGGTSLTLTNCTFENPCGPTDFTQSSVTTLGGLLPNTQFYFNGGNYTVGDTFLSLLPGQSLQSRSADFSRPATGTERSSITIEGIALQGNNSLENIVLLRVSEPSADVTGVRISGENNSIVGSQISESNNSYELAISDAGTNTLINNTTIFADTIGYDVDGGTMDTVIENSIINITSNQSNVLINDVEGISFSGSNSNLTVNNSLIKIENNNFRVNTDTYGIFVSPSNTVNVNNSTIVVDGLSSSRTYDLRNINSNMMVNGGNLNAKSSGIDVGIVDPNEDPVTIQGGTVCRINGVTVAC